MTAATIVPHQRRAGQPATHALFHTVIKDRHGRVKHDSLHHNLRTNAGADWQAALMGSAAGTPAQYMALSNSNTFPGTHPAAADTTLTGEITSTTDTGLVRALGVYAHTTGTTSYTISKTGGSAFTAATGATVYGEALFTAASAGTMPFESALTSAPVMNAGDTLALTVTVNF